VAHFAWFLFFLFLAIQSPAFFSAQYTAMGSNWTTSALRYTTTYRSALIFLPFARYVWQGLEKVLFFSSKRFFIVNSWWENGKRFRRQCKCKLCCCHSLVRQVRYTTFNFYVFHILTCLFYYLLPAVEEKMALEVGHAQPRLVIVLLLSRIFFTPRLDSLDLKPHKPSSGAYF